MAKKKSAKKEQSQEQNRREDKAASETVFGKINYYLILLSVFSVPLIFTTFTFDPFDLPKNAFFRVVVSIMSVLFLLDLYYRKDRSFYTHPAIFFAVGFLVFAAISTAFSVEFWTSFWGKYRRFEGFLAFFFYVLFLFLSINTFAHDKRRIEGVVKTAMLSAVVISIYGIAQYLGYDFLKWGSLPFEERRSFATMGNPALLAGYLVTVFPLSLGYSIFSHRKSDLVFSILATILTFTCLITSFNRTSWLAVALSLVFLAVVIYFLWRRKAVDKDAVLNMMVILVSLVLLFGILSIASQLQRAPLTVSKRIEQIINFSGGLAHRFEIWKAGFRMIYDRPFLGLGPDTYRATSRMYQGENYGHVAPDIVADNAHNYEIQIAAGVGVPGFLFFAALVIYVFIEGLRILYVYSFSKGGKVSYYSTKELAGLGANLGLIFSFVSYLFQLVTSVSIIGSTLMWWFVFAAILSQGKRVFKVTISEKKKSSVVVLIVFSIILFIANSIVHYRLVYADYLYFQAKAFSNYPMYVEYQRKFIDEAMRYNPWQWDIPAEAARTYFNAYKATENKEYLESALRYALLAESLDNHEADIKALITQIYLEMSGFDKAALVDAESYALKMTEMMPHHYASWLLLGAVYIEQGLYEKAISALENSVRNNPRSGLSYYYLAVCYQNLGDKEKEAYYLEKTREVQPELLQKK